LADGTESLRALLTGEGVALPVLFIGSGLSRRYIGSPDWEGLLTRFAALTSKSMPYYRSSADGDLPQIASLIAEEFRELWFAGDEYAESRKDFEELVQHRSDPLKYEIAKYLDALPVVDDAAMQQELEALSTVHAQAVLTTNWDQILERALPDLEVFVGQSDVLFNTVQAIGEIYKIHGSVIDPRSMVLTREDYEEYWRKNPYLIAKILTLLVEHPVIFLGYSISDPHIRRLLDNLVSCLTPPQLRILNDRLIFVRRGEDDQPVELRQGTITIADHTISIHEYSAHDFCGLYQMLASIPRTFPPKMMRQLRESVYKLAFEASPRGRLHVLPLDAGENYDDWDAVLGVGTLDRIAEKGYGHFNREDLISDMIRDLRDHNAALMMKRLIPELFALVKWAPVYYPLRLGNLIDSSGAILDEDKLPPKARNLVQDPNSIQYVTPANSPRRSMQFRELLSLGDSVAINYGTVCRFDVEDVVALRQFLSAQIAKSRKIASAVAKLACRYDHLVYGFGFTGDIVELHLTLGIEAFTDPVIDITNTTADK
jgi:hypothetical protein